MKSTIYANHFKHELYKIVWQPKAKINISKCATNWSQERSPGRSGHFVLFLWLTSKSLGLPEDFNNPVIGQRGPSVSRCNVVGGLSSHTGPAGARLRWGLPLPVFNNRLLGSVCLSLHPRHPAVAKYLQVPAEMCAKWRVRSSKLAGSKMDVQISMKTDARLFCCCVFGL